MWTARAGAQAQSPGQIAMNDAVGGAIWGQDVMLGDWPDHSGLSLLGQFAVTDPSSLKAQSMCWC